MNILQHITEKVAALEGEIARVLVVSNGGMTHALVLAHMGEDLFSTWVSCTTSDKVWRGLSSGHHDMTLAEAEADFELRAAETTPFATTRDEGDHQAKTLLMAAPVDLLAMVEAADPINANAAWGRLARLAVWAAFVSVYTETRCMSHGHDEAVKRANRVRAGLRKLLGYRITHDLNI